MQIIIINEKKLKVKRRTGTMQHRTNEGQGKM